MKPNYISSIYHRATDSVLVFERDPKNGRKVRSYPAPWYFYAPDEDGKFTSTYGTKLSRHDFDSRADFEQAASRTTGKHESDISPELKVLMNNYFGVPAPTLNVGLIDIEVDYKKELGFSSPENPYAPINAVTIWMSSSDQYVTLAVPPPGWDKKLPAEEDYKKIQMTIRPDIIICQTEKELLQMLLDLVDDCDLISGWNSEFFDLPYMIKRTELVLGASQAARWSFPQCRPPQFGMVERFGNEQMNARIFGRVHLDYLQIFRKFNLEGRSSYALANIAEAELHFGKLEYDGTLESLYKDDFILFLLYNIRDVECLNGFEKKFKYLNLANTFAHGNTSQLDAVMGTVGISQTAIINYAHYERDLIVPDSGDKPKGGKAEGAIVLSPKVGLHDWIGSVDINSLYPSTIRSLNLSPEMIRGQFTNYEDDWLAIKEKRKDYIARLVYEDGTSEEQTGAKWNEHLRSLKWAVSAYGTVLDQNQQGIVPGILTQWFKERKQMQAEKKKYAKLAKELKKEGKLKEAEEAQIQSDNFDILQGVRKVNLNSVYGALLNKFFKFFDDRLGCSTTACGRQITTFMNCTIGELITGEAVEWVKTSVTNDDGDIQHIYTTTSPVLITADTDSSYFKTMAKDKDEAIAISDMLAETVNDLFPDFMRESFLCNPGFDDLVKAAREVVAERGIFQAKKKYILRCMNIEGTDYPDGKLKTMGSEIKKSDTPKIIQAFLTQVIDKILRGGIEKDLSDYVIKSRSELMTPDNIIAMGVPKAVNNLEEKYREWEMFEKPGIRKVNLPGHVRAAINFNEMVKTLNADDKQIHSGDKVRIYYLKANEFNYKSIAIPNDLTGVPAWFNDYFTIDTKLTEEKMVDAKLKSVYAAMGWEVPTVQGTFVNSLLEF